MVTFHAVVAVALLISTLALIVYAWTARRRPFPPLGMRLLLMGVAVLLLMQYGAGTGMLARGHGIIGSHYGTAILAVPLLALPTLGRSYKPLLWLGSSAGLFLVMLGTAFVGWNR